ncbi:potassium-transporting ATPase subunit F [Cupriavidus basilensis]|uniref:Potassium-transporting ATPase subunit F n=1 Tax=Cupriavidus basilensis TaxID=68895 RepID=A0ABT6AWR0_9BURK|nr:potassium-transporting ATPase subunit F [Cupriavidus basilensis]MDF3837068.1 potassium-transporting ATPase subunit F [Cupriavidus basilensis]
MGVTIVTWLAAGLSLFVFVYLVLALIRPEWF